MSKNIKLFLVVVILSLPFWWGVNLLNQYAGDIFYGLAMANYPPITARLVPLKTGTKTADLLKTIEPALTAKSVIVAEVKNGQNEKIIFEKKSSREQSIASLTKLMTAVVVNEFYPSDMRIRVSEKAVDQMEATGLLEAGTVLRKEDLLYIMLIESSNDAAFALAEAVGTEAFVGLMNLKAKELRLDETYFSNPIGLDPEDVDPALFGTEPIRSSANDLLTLAEYIIEKHTSMLDILAKQKYELYLENGAPHHLLKSTNELLGVVPEVIAGKTGYTGRAGGCLLTISQGRGTADYLVTVVLGSEHRFEETKRILKEYYR